MFHFFIYQEDGTLLRVLNGALNANVDEELGKYDSLTADFQKTDENVELFKDAYYIGYQDLQHNYRLFKLDRPTFSADRITITAVDSASYDLTTQGYINDEFNYDEPTRLSDALNAITANTNWNYHLNCLDSYRKIWFYHEMAKDALDELCETFKVELAFRYETKGSKISKRIIEVYQPRGENTGITVVNGKNSIEFTYYKDLQNIITGAIGLGKDVPNVEKTKNEPMTFASVVWTNKPKDQMYIDLPDLTKRYGWIDSITGKRHPRLAIYKDDKAETPEDLIKNTYDWLKTQIKPTCSITATAQDVGQVNLGDTVTAADKVDKLVMQERVTKIKRNLLNDKLSQLTIGTYTIPDPEQRASNLIKQEKKTKKYVKATRQKVDDLDNDLDDLKDKLDPKLNDLSTELGNLSKDTLGAAAKAKKASKDAKDAKDKADKASQDAKDAKDKASATGKFISPKGRITLEPYKKEEPENIKRVLVHNDAQQDPLTKLIVSDNQLKPLAGEKPAKLTKGQKAINWKTDFIADGNGVKMYDPDTKIETQLMTVDGYEAAPIVPGMDLDRMSRVNTRDKVTRTNIVMGPLSDSDGNLPPIPDQGLRLATLKTPEDIEKLKKDWKKEQDDAKKKWDDAEKKKQADAKKKNKKYDPKPYKAPDEPKFDQADTGIYTQLKPNEITRHGSDLNPDYYDLVHAKASPGSDETGLSMTELPFDLQQHEKGETPPTIPDYDDQVLNAHDIKALIVQIIRNYVDHGVPYNNIRRYDLHGDDDPNGGTMEGQDSQIMTRGSVEDFVWGHNYEGDRTGSVYEQLEIELNNLAQNVTAQVERDIANGALTVPQNPTTD